MLVLGLDLLTIVTYWKKAMVVTTVCVCVAANWWHLLDGAKFAVVALAVSHEYKKRTGHRPVLEKISVSRR